MERARLELATRSSNWFDPKLVTVGVQIAQQIGWRRLVSLAGAALLAAGLAREWSGRRNWPPRRMRQRPKASVVDLKFLRACSALA